MPNLTKSTFGCLLCLAVAAALTCTAVAKGSRGSRSSRYSSRSSSSYRFSYRVNRLAYSRGIFFSTWAWRRSHSDYTDSSVLCFNVLDSLPAEYNSSVVEPWLYQNRTVYGLFVCPIDPDRQDRVYCCGEDESQWCCSFWEDASRVAAAVFGIISCLASFIIAAYRLYKVCRGTRCACRNQVEDSPTDEIEEQELQEQTPQSTVRDVEEAASSSTAGAEADATTNGKPELPPRYDSVLEEQWRQGQQLPPPPSYWEVTDACEAPQENRENIDET